MQDKTTYMRRIQIAAVSSPLARKGSRYTDQAEPFTQCCGNEIARDPAMPFHPTTQNAEI